jgi:hypothetical protein
MRYALISDIHANLPSGTIASSMTPSPAFAFMALLRALLE